MLRSAVANPRRTNVMHRKVWCKIHGVEFDQEFMLNLPCPETCPVLGAPISFERGSGKRAAENTASFDRIDPSKGYIAGNVMVVSNKANTMKSNATPSQLQRFAQWVMAEWADAFAPC